MMTDHRSVLDWSIRDLRRGVSGPSKPHESESPRGLPWSPFIDRLIDTVTDPGTSLVLLIGLWRPAIVVVLGSIAIIVYSARVLARWTEPRR
jgi:hypothetical protein